MVRGRPRAPRRRSPSRRWPTRCSDRGLTGRDAEMVLNGVYLVADADATGSARSWTSCGARHAAGLELELTGPWPPYHFVKPLDVTAAMTTTIAAARGRARRPRRPPARRRRRHRRRHHAGGRRRRPRLRRPARAARLGGDRPRGARPVRRLRRDRGRLAARRPCGHAGLGAIAGDPPRPPPGRRALGAARRVVEALPWSAARAADALSAAVTEDAVRFLDERHALTAALERVRGAVELGVRRHVPAERARLGHGVPRRAAARGPNARTSRSPRSRAYIAPPRPARYLVDRDAVGRVPRACAPTSTRGLACSGPWPPYSFVG